MPDSTTLALDDLRRVSEVLDVAPLTRAAVAELADSAGLALSAAALDVLMDRTSGNAFFVTELLALLGSASASPDLARRILASEVPANVTEVVRRRVARLPSPVADLLSGAAVLGVRFDVSTLAATVGLPVEAVLNRLERAVDAGLLVGPGPERTFSHGLVRDALYESIAASSRHRLHLAASVHTASTSERARHALAALPLGDPRAAVALAVTAARDAASVLGHEDAAELLNHALEAGAAVLDDDERANLLLELGDALRACGDTARASSVFEAAASLLSGDAEGLARAALGYADPGADLGLAYQRTDQRTAELLQSAIDAQAQGATATKSRLLARLAAELYFSNEAERSLPLAEEALSMAHRVDDASCTVSALAVYHDAHEVGRLGPSGLLARSAELLELARRSGDPVDLLIAHRARVLDLLVAGDLPGVDAEIAAFRYIAERRGTPASLWWPALWRAMRLQLAGDEAAEAAAVAAFAVGERPFPGLAWTNMSFQLFFLRLEQGRLRELEADARLFAADNPQIHALRVGHALTLAESGRTEEAAGLASVLAADGFALLRDRNWPASFFQLALIAKRLDRADWGGSLLDGGMSLSGQCVMVSLGTVCLGSADLAIGWLHDSIGQRDDALAAYDRAAATNVRIGAAVWAARARADADALRAPPADGHDGTSYRPGGRGTFRRDGATWRVGLDGNDVSVPSAKGLLDLAVLLARPGEPYSAVELFAMQAGDDGARTHSGEVLDAAARRQLKTAIADLDRDLAEAEEQNDIGRSAILRHQRDMLIDEVATALGLGGRARRLDDPGERARKAITARIRNSIARIERSHAALGRHLARSVDTGRWCTYRPERPVDWQL